MWGKVNGLAVREIPMTKSQIPINDQCPSSKGQTRRPIAFWKLDIGLLLLKFFPPRQDFLVAAEGRVGIWITTAQILCVTARFSRLRISAFGIHSGIRVSSFLGHWSFGIENGVATTEQIPNDE